MPPSLKHSDDSFTAYFITEVQGKVAGSDSQRLVVRTKLHEYDRREEPQEFILDVSVNPPDKSNRYFFSGVIEGTDTRVSGHIQVSPVRKSGRLMIHK